MNKDEKILNNNPKSCYSAANSNAVFVITNQLSPAGGGRNNEMTPPLNFFAGYSRFVFSIIDIAKTDSVTANLKPQELSRMREVTQYAYQKHLDSLYMPKKEDDIKNSLAYTLKLSDASFGGRTALEFFASSFNEENAKKTLLEYIEYLKKNVGSNNRDEIKAIQQAVKLYEEDKFPTILLFEKAFNKRITSGALKGKTPIEVFSEYEDAKTKLENQLNWLKSNLNKNPRYRKNNLEQIQAIQEGLNLFNKGKLNESLLSQQGNASVEGKRISIYPELSGSNMRPILRKTNPNGKTFVYELRIDWVVGEEYPVKIEIKNYYATVIKQENGTINVKSSEKEAEQKVTFALSSSAWFEALQQMEYNVSAFIHLNSADAYRIAESISKKNRPSNPT